MEEINYKATVDNLKLSVSEIAKDIEQVLAGLYYEHQEEISNNNNEFITRDNIHHCLYHLGYIIKYLSFKEKEIELVSL